jgi:TPR repeat protein
MIDAPSLRKARAMLREKKFQEAIAVFERLIDDRSEDGFVAAYSLGIVHELGAGVPASEDKAIEHFLFAERSGRVPMATYQLARIYMKRGEIQKAYDSYRIIARTNPSAAYRAYRLLVTNKRLDIDPGASDRYLESAADQGHVLAQRLIALNFLKGKKGVLNIPHGVKMFVEVVFNIFRVVVMTQEKLKYQ